MSAKSAVYASVTFPLEPSRFQMLTACLQRPSKADDVSWPDQADLRTRTGEETSERHCSAQTLQRGIHVASVTQIPQSRYPDLLVLPRIDWVIRANDAQILIRKLEGLL